MGASNDYDTAPEAGSDEEEGLSDEQYQWLQEQLAHIGHLRIEEEGEGEEEEEWVDPSGGVLLNIYAACESGDADRLAASLADLATAQHSIDTPGPDGDTALHLACLYGHLPCVQQLLAAGCKGGAVNSEDGTSPLHDAAAGGHLAIVQLLLSQAGGDALLPLQDSDGDTALHNAARGGHLDVVQCLLARGAPVGTLNSSGKTAAAEAEEASVVAALVAAARQQQQQQVDGGSSGGGGGGDAAAAAAACGSEQQPPQQQQQAVG